MASNTSADHRPENFSTIPNEHIITRTNFICFHKCSICPSTGRSLCEHANRIIIEPILKNKERRPAAFKCLVCDEVPKSALKLVKHLKDEHNVKVNFRCAECKKKCKSFLSVVSHQRFCANQLPEPLPKKPKFTASSNRPLLNEGLLHDIDSIPDPMFKFVANKVLFRQQFFNIDSLLYEFNRIVGRRRRRINCERTSNSQSETPTLDPNGWWTGDRNKAWSCLTRGEVNSDLDINAAYEFFNSNLSTSSANLLTPIMVHPPNSIDITEYIDQSDILYHLNAKKKSTPGLDNISAADLLAHLDILKVMLNLCLWVNDIPREWRESTTTLIPKKASTDPADYRPITVGSMAYRILTAILARRLQNRLEPHCCQKGFLPQDGVHEAITVCRYLSDQGYCIAAIDVAKAFDSVSQAAIHEICTANGLTEPARILLKNLYRDCQTRLKVNGQHSAAIRIRRGVKQGDPLSPILFNMVVDQLLRRLELSGSGVDLDGRRLPGLAFADDLLLFGSDEQEVEELAKITVDFYKEVGLSINTRKTKVMSAFGPVTINGEEIAPCTSFRYLGTMIDPTNSSRYRATKVCYKLHKVVNASLPPRQKLYLIRQHLLPELTHRLVHEKSLASTLSDIDGKIRTAVKRILGLPNSTPTSFFYLSLKNGGLALPQLRFDVPKTSVKRLVRLTTSNSWFVRLISNSKWFKSEVKRVNRLCPVDLDNQKRLLNDIRKINDGHAYFLIGGTLINRHFSGTTRMKPEKFQKLVQLRAGMMVAHEEHCLTCNEPKTMQHLLNKCPITKRAQNARHNRILEKILNHLHRHRPDLNVYREERIPTADGFLIPDLLIADPSNRTAYCFDVGVSYEQRSDSLDNYDQVKRTKYGQISDDIIDWLHNEGNTWVDSLVTHGLIFGSRASIQNTCLNILVDTFGISKNNLANMMIQCAIDSHDIVTRYRSWDPEEIPGNLPII